MDDQLTSPVGPITEGEIITPSDQGSESGPQAAQSIMDLTGTINSHISQLERLKVEVGKFKEMLDDIFVSDAVFQEHDKAVREASKIRANTKKQILKTPQAADLSANILDLRAQIKERNQELSDYLQEYARSTGTSSFETEDGRVKQIIYTARLVSIGQ